MNWDSSSAGHFLCVFVLLFIRCPQGLLSLEAPKLRILNVSEHEVHVSWTPLRGQSVEKYQISAFPVQSFTMLDNIKRSRWSFSNSTTRSELMGLQPGTLYNLSITAHSSDGESDPTFLTVWTEVGAPNKPSPVEVVDRHGKTMTVILPVGTSYNGPITSYHVISLEKTPITVFNEEELGSYHQAQENGFSYYITADLTPQEANQTFIIGDQKTYGSYYNAPLLEDRDYEILVGIVSTWNGVTKTSYSPLQSAETKRRISNGNSDDMVRRSSPISVALSAAIGVFGFLLVLSVIIYFLLRKHYGKRRPSDELVLRVHGSDGEENGFLPGILHLDSDTDLTEFYNQLKEHYWQIPKSQIEVHQSVLGIGQFGEVREGLVRRRSQNIQCLVQHTQGPLALGDKEKRNLLKELDMMARTGFHPNIVEFVGACEERGILLVAIEHHSTSLRGLLLRSRQQNNGQICTFSGHHLLEICAGISQGMSHLADRGIVHCHLSARNIVISNGSIPKVAHFGMGHYDPLGRKLLYSRWAAPEVLNTNSLTAKSDVWSFGVVLWEIFTLGGSPYPLVPVKELMSRVMQGMRLNKPRGISDDLYQLMLHCWELDPDERPKFLEMSSLLQNLFLNATEHVNFQNLKEFQHEKFDPNAEDD